MHYLFSKHAESLVIIDDLQSKLTIAAKNDYENSQYLLTLKDQIHHFNALNSSQHSSFEENIDSFVNVETDHSIFSVDYSISSCSKLDDDLNRKILQLELENEQIKKSKLLTEKRLEKLTNQISTSVHAISQRALESEIDYTRVSSLLDDIKILSETLDSGDLNILSSVKSTDIEIIELTASIYHIASILPQLNSLILKSVAIINDQSLNIKDDLTDAKLLENMKFYLDSLDASISKVQVKKDSKIILLKNLTEKVEAIENYIEILHAESQSLSLEERDLETLKTYMDQIELSISKVSQSNLKTNEVLARVKSFEVLVDSTSESIRSNREFADQREAAFQFDAISRQLSSLESNIQKLEIKNTQTTFSSKSTEPVFLIDQSTIDQHLIQSFILEIKFFDQSKIKDQIALNSIISNTIEDDNFEQQSTLDSHLCQSYLCDINVLHQNLKDKDLELFNLKNEVKPNLTSSNGSLKKAENISLSSKQSLRNISHIPILVKRDSRKSITNSRNVTMLEMADNRNRNTSLPPQSTISRRRSKMIRKDSSDSGIDTMSLSNRLSQYLADAGGVFHDPESPTEEIECLKQQLENREMEMDAAVSRYESYIDDLGRKLRQTTDVSKAFVLALTDRKNEIDSFRGRFGELERMYNQAVLDGHLAYSYLNYHGVVDDDVLAREVVVDVRDFKIEEVGEEEVEEEFGESFTEFINIVASQSSFGKEKMRDFEQELMMRKYESKIDDLVRQKDHLSLGIKNAVLAWKESLREIISLKKQMEVCEGEAQGCVDRLDEELGESEKRNEALTISYNQAILDQHLLMSFTNNLTSTASLTISPKFEDFFADQFVLDHHLMLFYLTQDSISHVQTEDSSSKRDLYKDDQLVLENHLFQSYQFDLAYQIDLAELAILEKDSITSTLEKKIFDLQFHKEQDVLDSHLYQSYINDSEISKLEFSKVETIAETKSTREASTEQPFQLEEYEITITGNNDDLFLENQRIFDQLVLDHHYLLSLQNDAEDGVTFIPITEESPFATTAKDSLFITSDSSFITANDSTFIKNDSQFIRPLSRQDSSDSFHIQKNRTLSTISSIDSVLISSSEFEHLKFEEKKVARLNQTLKETHARLRARDQYLQNTIMDTAKQVAELENRLLEKEMENEELMRELKFASEDKNILENELIGLDHDNMILQNQLDIDNEARRLFKSSNGGYEENGINGQDEELVVLRDVEIQTEDMEDDQERELMSLLGKLTFVNMIVDTQEETIQGLESRLEELESEKSQVTGLYFEKSLEVEKLESLNSNLNFRVDELWERVECFQRDRSQIHASNLMSAGFSAATVKDDIDYPLSSSSSSIPMTAESFPVITGLSYINDELVMSCEENKRRARHPTLSMFSSAPTILSQDTEIDIEIDDVEQISNTEDRASIRATSKFGGIVSSQHRASTLSASELPTRPKSFSVSNVGRFSPMNSNLKRSSISVFTKSDSSSTNISSDSSSIQSTALSFSEKRKSFSDGSRTVTPWENYLCWQPLKLEPLNCKDLEN